ncbi:MAG TPA: PQQ-binding-like beta-propeller repeat protein, partial [Vicinamibacteria bacterium]
MKRRVVLALCLAGLSSPLFPAQPQFFKLEGSSDFLEGELQGLSVDSDGRVRLAPATKVLHDAEAPFVWCLATDAKGVLYAGTGNEGKVYRIADGKASLFFDAPELEVHALAVGKDDKLYVGTSPDGKVYALDATARSTPFFDPADKYIWALAFDGSGNLLVATGGEGRVYRVDAKGASSTLLQTAET